MVDAAVLPNDVIGALRVLKFDAVVSDLELGRFEDLLLRLTFLERAVKLVRNDELLIVFILELGEILLELGCLVKLGVAEHFVALQQQLEHASIVEGEADVGYLALLLLDAQLLQFFLKLISHVALEAPNGHVVEALRGVVRVGLFFAGLRLAHYPFIKSAVHFPTHRVVLYRDELIIKELAIDSMLVLELDHREGVVDAHEDADRRHKQAQVSLHVHVVAVVAILSRAAHLSEEKLPWRWRIVHPS